MAFDVTQFYIQKIQTWFDPDNYFIGFLLLFSTPPTWV